MDYLSTLPVELLERICKHLNHDELHLFSAVSMRLADTLHSIYMGIYDHAKFLRFREMGPVAESELKPIRLALEQWYRSLPSTIPTLTQDHSSLVPADMDPYKAELLKATMCDEHINSEAGVLRSLIRIFQSNDYDCSPEVVMPELVEQIKNAPLTCTNLSGFRLKALCLVYTIGQIVHSKPRNCRYLTCILEHLKSIKSSHRYLDELTIFASTFKKFLIQVHEDLEQYMVLRLRNRESIGRFYKTDDWVRLVKKVAAVPMGKEFEFNGRASCLTSIINMHNDPFSRRVLRFAMSNLDRFNCEVVALLVYMIVFRQNGYDTVQYGSRKLFFAADLERVNQDNLCQIATDFTNHYVKCYYQCLLNEFK